MYNNNTPLDPTMYVLGSYTEDVQYVILILSSTS